ncbi:hypothetical protein [Gilliamella sp. Occ4-3]|uniref:hypothetical protein n=1 Tax=Gilliamella sp. Occ4-3 TaxID=3120254 RepID=UPI00080E6251|nr:hypothetical protein [Gilliamella apicola]OCG72961.1 hypothetical protein A9G44_09140 [Gilliamella apicola]
MKYKCISLILLLSCMSNMAYADWEVKKEGQTEITASIHAERSSEKNTSMSIGCTDLFSVNDNGDLRFFIYTEDPNFKNAGEVEVLIEDLNKNSIRKKMFSNGEYIELEQGSLDVTEVFNFMKNKKRIIVTMKPLTKNTKAEFIAFFDLDNYDNIVTDVEKTCKIK